jgi:hypothetical protein
LVRELPPPPLLKRGMRHLYFAEPGIFLNRRHTGLRIWPEELQSRPRFEIDSLALMKKISVACGSLRRHRVIFARLR